MKTKDYIKYDKERLKAISIVDVASQFGTVKRCGSTYKTLCPWHGDHNPSLSLVERTNENYCKCFVCNMGGDVIKYVEAVLHVDFCGACEWLSKQYGILTSRDFSFVPLAKKKPEKNNEESTPLCYIPNEMLDRLVTLGNPLCQCLSYLYRPEQVEWVTRLYHLGCYAPNEHDRWTIFPSIDVQGRVCNLKVQRYETNPKSPNFAHCPKGRSFWLATKWQEMGLLSPKGKYTTHCLFGEHLLRKYPALPVVLVESPKNVIVGALEHPERLWVAIGNKGDLKREMLRHLEGHDVLVIPDCDAIDEWTGKIDMMKDITNFAVSDFCRRTAPADKPKYDIADYFLDKRIRGVLESSRGVLGEFSGEF